MIEELSDRGFSVVSLSNLPNAPRIKPPLLALSDHFTRLSSALVVLSKLNAQGKPAHVFIDRSPLSLDVYSSLRQDEYLLTSAHVLLRALNGACFEGYRILVDFYFLLPPLQVLEERRSRTSKNYPYSARQELEIYGRLARFIEAYFPVTYFDD